MADPTNEPQTAAPSPEATAAEPAPPSGKPPLRPGEKPRLRAFGKALMALGAVLIAGGVFSSFGSGSSAKKTGAFSADVPPLEPGFVVDKAGALSEEQRTALTNEIAGLEAATGGGQMAVAFFTTLSGVPLEDASLRVARAWRLGREGVDDGALLLVATEDRLVRLEIGLGWEGPIPDARAGDIYRDLVPLLRESDWAGAATLAVREVRAAVTGEDVPKRPVPAKPGNVPWVPLGFLSLFAGVVARAMAEPDPPPGARSASGSARPAVRHSPSPDRHSSSGFRGGGGGRFGGGGAGGRF